MSAKFDSSLTSSHHLFASTSSPDPLASDGPSTGLILPPEALEVTGSNRFFRYASVGYSQSPNGYDAWSIANYRNWNFSKYLNPVWDQGACGQWRAGFNHVEHDALPKLQVYVLMHAHNRIVETTPWKTSGLHTSSCCHAFMPILALISHPLHYSFWAQANDGLQFQI